MSIKTALQQLSLSTARRLRHRAALVLATSALVLALPAPAAPQEQPAPGGNWIVRHSLSDGTTGQAVKPARHLSTEAAGNTAGLPLAHELSPEEQALICCPPDNRFRIYDTTPFPYPTICKVLVQFPSSNIFLGSAVMVGPRHALTAGHIVYDAAEGGWASSVLVEPGYNDGATPYGAYFATNLYSFVGYTQYGDSNYDFGMLEFGTDVGNTTGWLGYAVRSDSALRGSTLNTAGYPGDLYNAERMYGASGPCLDVSARQVYYAGTMDTAGGQSGSGVWTFDGVNRTVVAVHTFGSPSFNGGTRITQDVFDYIESVKNPSGGPPPDPPPPPAPGSVETLNLYLGHCYVKDYSYQGLDRTQLKTFYFFNDNATDQLLNPIEDGITIHVEAAGQVAMELKLGALDPIWKIKGRRKAIWNGYIGLSRVKFTMDVVKQTIAAKIDWFDLAVPPQNPIAVTILSGNDFGRISYTWLEQRPGYFKF